MKLLGYVCVLLFAAGLCACQPMTPEANVAGGMGVGTNADPTSGNDYGSSTPR